MKSLFVVFGVLLLIISLPVFFQSTHDAQVQEQTQSFAGIATAVSVNSANITMAQAVYADNLASITSVSSNITGDTPTAASFNSVSKVLNVTGLVQSNTRTLSVNYEIPSTLLPDGANVFFTVVRWFYVFTIIGMLAGAIYAFFD